MNREQVVNLIIGCIISSYLDNKTKERLVEFMRSLEYEACGE